MFPDNSIIILFKSFTKYIDKSLFDNEYFNSLPNISLNDISDISFGENVFVVKLASVLILYIDIPDISISGILLLKSFNILLISDCIFVLLYKNLFLSKVKFIILFRRSLLLLSYTI